MARRGTRKRGGQQAAGGIYDPRTLLTGKKLRRMVRSLTRRQTGAEIGAQDRQVQELRRILAQQTRQVRGLGEQATRNIGSYYQSLAEGEASNLARQQALGGRLRTEVGAGSQRAAGAVSGAGEAALARLREDEVLRGGVPSTARDELQALIAAQQGRTALESQTLEAGAAGRAADWEAAAGMLGRASQMRGAQTLTDTQREILNRITGLQQEYGPQIREGIGRGVELRTQRADLRRQILNELVGREREFMLSKGALGIDKRQLRAEMQGKTGQMALAKQYAKNTRAEQKRSLRNQLRVIQAQEGAGARKQEQSLRNQLAVLEAQGAGGGGGGKGGGRGYTKGEYRRAKDYARAGFKLDQITNRKRYNDVIAQVVSRGGDPEAIRAFMKRATPYGRSKRRKGRQPYGPVRGPGFSGFH